MTRLLRVISAVNWKYAIGEVVLIVVGILIALAAADWNEQRLERDAELELLDELRTSLQTDLVSVQTALKQVTDAEAQLVALQEVLADPGPYDPSVDSLFGAVYGNRIIFLNTASYETLKSIGLQRVSNDALRRRIASLFNRSYALMQLNNDIDRAINEDLLRPYYLQHFRNLEVTRSATPIDYAGLLANPYYRNLVDFRLFVMRSNRIRSYTSIAVEMQELLAMLDDELS